MMFHSLRGCDSHIIIREMDKFDVKVNVALNGLEKYVAFTINKNLVFIDCIRFLNPSLDALVKNLSKIDFKYLSQKFSGDLLKLVKQKEVYSYEYMDSSEKFLEKTLPDKCNFFSSLKGKCISEKDYLHSMLFGICLKRIQWLIIIIFIKKQTLCY